MNSLWDAHLHSAFSGDCQIPPQEMIDAAKKINLSGITFTDHLDWDYRESPGLFDLDISDYLLCIHDLAAKNNSAAFSVHCGIELGLQPHLAYKHQQLLTEYEFDFVIGSTHVIHGEDPYYPAFFSTRNQHDAFVEYYEMILENLNAFSNIDSLGHLDYCFRYAPYPDVVSDTYHPYASIVDEILSFIIKKDIALEINTGAFRSGLNEPNPSLAIIKRYRQMGGDLITLGADAHQTEHVGLCFPQICQLLFQCGFREYAVFKHRNPIFLSLLS